MPTLADAEAEIQRRDPTLIPLLLDATVSTYTLQGGYTDSAFRHPTEGVLARVMLMHSGQTGLDTATPTDIYGVYLYLPRRASGGPVADRGAAPAGDGAATETPTLPPDPLLDAYFREFRPNAGESRSPGPTRACGCAWPCAWPTAAFSDRYTMPPWKPSRIRSSSSKRCS